jgi:hypothetical protein
MSAQGRSDAPVIIRRYTVSTLSEIAANHAKAAKTLQAKSVMLSGLCCSTEQALEIPATQPAEQLTPHRFASISENVSGQVACHSY